MNAWCSQQKSIQLVEGLSCQTNHFTKCLNALFSVLCDGKPCALNSSCTCNNEISPYTLICINNKDYCLVPNIPKAAKWWHVRLYRGWWFSTQHAVTGCEPLGKSHRFFIIFLPLQDLSQNKKQTKKPHTHKQQTPISRSTWSPK